MSNHIVVSSVSYAPVSGTDQKVMEQTHKDLKDLVGRVARATKADLIVLPETICRNCDEEVPEGPTTQLLAGLAREYSCYITVPVHQKERKSGAVFNVLGLLDRQGGLAGIYRKYIPVYPEFDHGTRPGPGASLIQTEFGPVGGVICFDLNFGELRAQYKKLKPKVLLFSSMYHGGLVQNFWALDVQAFFIGSVYKGDALYHYRSAGHHPSPKQQLPELGHSAYQSGLRGGASRQEPSQVRRYSPAIRRGRAHCHDRTGGARR